MYSWFLLIIVRNLTERKNLVLVCLFVLPPPVRSPFPPIMMCFPLFQYCELKINEMDNDVFALAITFNRLEKDGIMLEPVEGLTMRIVERLLITRDIKGSDHQYYLGSFRNLWRRNNYNERMNLVLAIDGIQALLQHAHRSPKLLVLVDEPGLAGSSKRQDHGQIVDDGTDPDLAKELVESTSVLRLGERNVRFIFSSLK